MEMTTTFLGLDTTAWTAIYTLLTAALLLVAVFAAAYAFKQWQTAKTHAAEQRKAHTEATRPYVTVTVEPSLASKQLFDLIVRNIGKRPAENVTINIDPPPQRAREIDNEELHMRNMKLLNQPMAMLAPGQEVRAFYDNHLVRKNHPELPTAHKVTVAYTDTDSEPYGGDFVLDLEALKGMSWTEVGSIHTISQSIDSISKLLNRSSVLHRRGSLSVDAVTEDREQAQLREAQENFDSELGQVEFLAEISPKERTLASRRSKLARKAEQLQHERERRAVEPISRVYRRALNVCRYVLRNWRPSR